jgi:dephospho-CoA kinase
MNVETRKCVLGLVGGIGSGKSAVAAELQRRGARVIAGDQLGHEALEQPEIRERVVQRWGPSVLVSDPSVVAWSPDHATTGGRIDRRQLGRIVFADPAELRALEVFVFPYIERRFREEIAAAEADENVALIVLDAAVLFEANWNEMCDWIVYVHAPQSLRLKRVATQRGWSEKEVEARARAQLPLTEKVSRADATVDNSGPRAQLTRQIDGLWQLLVEKFPRSSARQIAS